MIVSRRSHVPIITALPSLFPIRRILECGSGIHSTPIFCNPDIYPGLLEFRSLENGSGDYADGIRKLVKQDSVYHYDYSGLSMAQFVNGYDVNKYDLVFIDDSLETPNRANTIANITRRAERPVIVIHDFEQQPYRDAIASVFTEFQFDTVLPFTVVLWKPGSFKDEPSFVTALQTIKDTVLPKCQEELNVASQPSS